MIRLGLCCMFREVPIKFRCTTATALKKCTVNERQKKLSSICRNNAESLAEAILYCAGHGIGAFRVNSQILPLKTHPEVGYELRDLPAGKEIEDRFRACNDVRKKYGVRLSFHPDQFVLLNSPRPDVTVASLGELMYQAAVAEWIGADVINIHAGGAYGDKPAALERLAKAVEHLPDIIRSRLTFENDDRTYSPSELLPVCRATGIPLVYDVHHHRCLPDEMNEEEATVAALNTWNREPLFHLSSPRNGWKKNEDPKPHHDLIDPADFPVDWRSRTLSVDVEAKAKEVAVDQLRRELTACGVPCWKAGNDELATVDRTVA